MSIEDNACVTAFHPKHTRNNMAENKKSLIEIEYEDIVWEEINLSKKTHVIETLRKIKNYYWEKYLRTGIKTLIEPGTNDFTFVYKAFSKWHNSWKEKTQGDKVVAFYIDMAEDQKSQCFHYKLENITLEHNDLGWTKGFKSPEQAIKSDVSDACRYVIKDYKERIRRSKFNTPCPITNTILSAENSEVHHEGLPMHQIIEAWVESKGGYKKTIPVYKQRHRWNQNVICQTRINR